jgi:ubiquinone/menaquinone biosynthesis C-methylase UbiE/DNA-binding transcriptional ArsR family regulator
MLAPPLLLDSFSALADATRCRMLLLLERHELTVSELCAVLQLPQSTVSRHLKTLSDVELVSSRRDGTSRYYSLTAGTTAQTELWQLIRRELEDRPGVAQDARRLERVLMRRSATSQQFFATAAGDWDRLRDELFGTGFYWQALLALLPAGWVIGELGCGTGAVVASLAPYVRQVIGVDASEEMLRAAEARVTALDNVQLRRGALEALPIDGESLDAATLVLVLHHLPAPAAAVSEAARVLRPGGRLLIVDMAPHEREEYRQQMGHVWLGFSEDQIRRLLSSAGFTGVNVRPLAPLTDAKGPALLAAVGTKGLRIGN